VDVGISVSRVGGSAQIKAMKKVAGTLKLDLAQFRELEAFAKFGSVDDATLKQLNRGKVMVEILKQKQYVPMSVENQVIIIFAGVNGYMDDIAINQVIDYEGSLIEYLTANKMEMIESISTSGKIEEDTEAELKKAITDFNKTFIKTKEAITNEYN